MLTKLGYRVPPENIFLDHFPGDLLWERPELSRLRDQIRKRRFKAVGVYALDRLGRKETHYAILFDEAERHGCTYISATEDIDNSKEGRLIRTIRGYAAEVEHEKIKDRIGRGLAKLKEARKPVPRGSPRYGYTWDKKQRVYVLDPPTAEIVGRIFDWSTRGKDGKPMSPYKIAWALNSLGVDCPAITHGRRFKSGKRPLWRATTVRLIIRDARYKGDPMMLGKHKSTGLRDAKGRSIIEPVPPEQWTEAIDPCPQIVDPETWKTANANVSNAKTGKEIAAETRNEKKPILLRGFVVCSRCGASMQPYAMNVHRKRDGVTWQYWRYRCGSATRKMESAEVFCDNKDTPVDWLDAFVWDWFVKNVLQNRRRIEQGFRDAIQDTDTEALTDALETHRQAIETIRGKKRTFIATVADSDDPDVREVFQAKVADFNRQLTAHEAEVETITRKLDAKREESQALTHLWDLVERTRATIAETATFDEKRRLFRAFGLQVVCKKRDITIRMRIPLPGGSRDRCVTSVSTSPTTS